MNKEFSFDVDESNIPCGINGALYFVEMESDGGKGSHSGNKIGAKYGAGYCDAKCPRSLKWINGEGNVENWEPSTTDPKNGKGKYGSCCAEIDLWEANNVATQMNVHTCDNQGQFRCEGEQCGGNLKSGNMYKGVCDYAGCEFNPYRLGSKEFYGNNGTVGKSFKIDTSSSD